MRNGNFFYRLALDGPVWLTHRGVSQGGRKLSPNARKGWWEKKKRPLPQGLELREEQGKVVVKATAAGLRAMREGNLVLVSNSGCPRVWTPKRIETLGERIRLA